MSIPSRSSFPPAVYAERIRKTLSSCRQQGLAGIVIATGPELAYFTGSWTRSHERLTALVISARGDVVFIAPATDSAQLAGVDAIGGIVIDTWRDGEDPYALVAAHLGSGPVALGSSLTADHVLRLQEAVGEIVLSGDVLDVFTVKEPQELEQLEHAATAIDTVHEHVPALLRPGRTEAEVAAELSELIGASHDKVDFIIVGSGPNGANPHHTHSDRVLAQGDPVVVDIGGSVGAGYHSDCTRTYVVGHSRDASFRAAYDVLRSAQAAAVATVRPGMSAGELDAVARSAINHSGYGAYFTHRLGHGIGLSLHEAPFITPGSTDVLEEGMVFSVEPGIYITGQWGMRIEDIVVLEARGARPLNAAPRNLIECGG